MQGYISPDQYAEVMGIHRNTVYRMITRGELRVKRNGRRISIQIQELEPDNKVEKDDDQAIRDYVFG